MQLKPTIEQKRIIKAYSLNFNIKIEANAGSGKTSTCLFLAQANPSKHILLLTFNRQLSDESKFKFSNFSNVSVQTVHGFVKGLYNQSGFDSQMLLNVLSKNIQPVSSIHFDVLILDEFQDFSPLMIKLIFKSLFSINKSAQLVILGSYSQCIYEVFDSDIRFLKYCQDLFTDNNLPWKTLTLSKSFRLTPQMQLFINQVILHAPHFSFNRNLIRKKNLSDVVYWIGNPYDDFCIWFDKHIADQYHPDQIFILAPSVNNTTARPSSRRGGVSPIVKFQYHLSSRKYPVYVCETISEKPQEDHLEDSFKSLTQGKTIISSYHSSKGCERDVVIVFNFDNSYFSFFAKSFDPSFCSNPQYVAITRAKQKLVLIQGNNLMLNFIDKTSISSYCQILPDSGVLSFQQSKFIPSHSLIKKYAITNLVRQQNSIDFSFFSQFYSFHLQSVFPTCSYSLPNRIPGRYPDTFEDVSDFNGDISTLYFQFLNTSKIPSFSDQELSLPFLQPINRKINHSKLKIPLDLFYTVQILYVLYHGYSHRLTQVKNWVQNDHLDAIQQSFYHYFHPSNKNLLFEQKFSFRHNSSDILSSNHLLNISYNNIDVTGIVDIIDNLNKKIIEIKYVKELLPHHFQQLFFYYVLINLSDSSFSDYSYEIFNIKSGQVFRLQLNPDIPPLKDLLFKLIRSNIISSGLLLSDQQFFDDISSYFDFIRSSSDLHLDLDLARSLSSLRLND